MYKLWRRELSNPIILEPNTKMKQSNFTEILSQIVKLVKKKQQFYIKTLFTIQPRPHSSDQHDSTLRNLKNNELQFQLQNILGEQDEIISSFKQYQSQPFFMSKTYLYTLFIRLNQIFEFSRQKILIKLREQRKLQTPLWEKYYDDNRLTLNDFYQNRIYSQNYDIAEFLSLALRKQNHRLYSLIPPKIKKNQLTLKPIARLNSTDLKSRMSVSELKSSKKKLIVEQLLAKKLKKKEKKLQSQKRIDQTKKSKLPNQTVKSLYNIMNIKQPKIEEGYAFMKGLEIDAFERNATIIEQRNKLLKEIVQKRQKQQLKWAKNKDYFNN